MKAYLEPGEIVLLERAASNLRDQLMVHLLFRLGARISEVLALAVDDIDFTECTITIQHLKWRTKLACPKCGARLGRRHAFSPECGAEVHDALAKDWSIAGSERCLWMMTLWRRFETT